MRIDPNMYGLYTSDAYTGSPGKLRERLAQIGDRISRLEQGTSMTIRETEKMDNGMFVSSAERKKFTIEEIAHLKIRAREIQDRLKKELYADSKK